MIAAMPFGSIIERFPIPPARPLRLTAVDEQRRAVLAAAGVLIDRLRT